MHRDEPHRCVPGCPRPGRFVSSTSMFARWLLPICIALSVLCSAVSGIAAAGASGEVSCCCPSPEHCTCHDHDDAPKPSTIRRCSGDLTLVAPALACFELTDPEPIPVHDSRPAVAELPSPTIRTSQCWLK